MAGTEVMQQSPMPLIQANQSQATGEEDAAKEVVPEESVTKYMTKEAGASTAQHTHHQSVTLREKWGILERF